ncbi:MAG: hypothetical protein JO257_15440 [Deltaproteobacteria bacterium]|nr:hypothetical protein [Deltaproteobacteria bacterium]
MTSHIYTWTDGYLAVRHRAFETRGGIEVDTGSARWPRTTGGDALAIASVFDPAVRANATPGVLRRWRAALGDLEQDALASSRRTYPHNRTFWAAVEMAGVFLDDIAIASPASATWDALLEIIGAHPRNSGPGSKDPFGLTAGTFDDLWLAQRKLFGDKRGIDQPDPPPGFGMKGLKIPRTTNADVIQLAAYWSDQLGKAAQVMGYKAAVDKWRAALADVEKYARSGKPDDLYPKNNEFWHTLNDVSIQIAIGDEAPTSWDIAMASVKDSITHLPENVKHAASEGVDLLASAAHAVGKVANEAGKGLFAGFGTPLLVGAGLVGLFLISRGHGHEEA